MSVFLKSGISNVLGTAAADQILVANPEDAIAGAINGAGGLDELRFTSTIGEYLLLGANLTNVESVVIGTGSGAVAVTTGTTAEAVDASLVGYGLAITGNNGANEIIGTAFADTITGGKGADVLYGGEGNDSFIIAAAGDHVDGELTDGEDGYDTIVFTSTTAGANLILSSLTDVEAAVLGPATGTTALNIYADNLLNGTGIALTGNAGNNVLSGSGWNDALTGGGGNDTLVGGAGDDRFFIGALAEYGVKESLDGGVGNDTLFFQGIAGQTLVLNATTSGIDQVVIRNPGAPLAAVNLDAHNVPANEGNGLALIGNDGPNVLIGTAGRDRLVGKGGNDVFLISAVSHFPENETILGGDGRDEIRFAATTPGETLVLEGRYVDGVEAIVIGTGVAPAAVATGTTALNVNASEQSQDIAYLGNAGPNNIQDGAGNGLLDGGAGNDTLKGGEGNDTLVGGAGSDSLDGGTGTGLLDGGAGNDTLKGGEGNDTLIGGADSDSLDGGNGTGLLDGGAGNDTIQGGDGDDTLVGGAGNDFLFGGTGSNVYLYRDAAEGGAGEVAATHPAGTNLLRFVGASGTLLVPTQGESENFQSIELVGATATSPIGVNAALWTVGVAITGNGGANAITGTAGNDTITGGAGADNLAGGPGNDRFVVASPADFAGDVYAGGIGADSVRLGTAGLYLFAASTTGIEVIDWSNPADTAAGAGVSGAALGTAVKIFGTAGANVLTGGAGNDTIVGGNGIDTMSGGAGNDTFLIVPSGFTAEDDGFGNITVFLSGDGVNLGALDLVNGGAGFDTLVFDTTTLGLPAGVQGLNLFSLPAASAANGGFEAVALAGSDNIGVWAADYATALVITGNEGDNHIVGTAGNDTINGGGGNDVFNVKGARTAGLDAFDGGDGYDYIGYYPTEDGETLAPAGLSGVETISMSDSPYAEGAAVAANFSAAASTNAMFIFGNAADNALNGSRFDDTIDGKGGNDSLIGGAGKDLLEGGSGDDVLAGGSGNDTLDGGAGNDVLVGNAGDDVFLDMQTTDVAIGGRGTDVLRFTGAGLTLNLPDFAITSIEGVDITGSGDNTLWGLDLGSIDLLGGPAPLTWTVDGDAGDRVQIASDESVMPSASDGYTLYVGTHSTVRIDQDIIIFHLVAGSDENEVLTGGAGNDYIWGGGGVDTLVAGAGNDTLSGGAGNDVFRLAAQTAYPSSSPDTIENFSSGIDRIELAALSFGPLPPGGDVDAHFNSSPGAVFTSVSDYFVYDTTTGELYYSPVGSAVAPALIATLTGHPTLLASDISMV